jgi:hypothetical protein
MEALGHMKAYHVDPHIIGLEGEARDRYIAILLAMKKVLLPLY